MVSFVHLADKNDEQLIRKNGIRSVARRSGLRGVYATPVVPNFAVTHQWARELKRRGMKTLICVQFRIPDAEHVFVGPYNGEKRKMTAAEAGCRPRPRGPRWTRSDRSEKDRIEGDHADIPRTANYRLAVLSDGQRKSPFLPM